MSTQDNFLSGLEASLTPHLLYPNAPRENDLTHANRLIRPAPEIGRRCRLDFDEGEFRAAALLHEIDRSTSLHQPIIELGQRRYRNNSGNKPKDEFLKKAGIEIFLKDKLSNSCFGLEARDRITRTVLEHSKRGDDLEHDPHLLTALRIADKLDRMGPYGICTAIIHHCPALPLFDPISPFGYKSTVEGKLGSVYDDWMRVFEWYAMLPFDAARAMAQAMTLRTYGLVPE